MLLSYNWLKELVDFDLTPSKLDEALTILGIEVEGITDYRKKYENFYTAKVLKKEKHPDADKLSVCRVKYGENEQTVVCGAPNVDEGQVVVLGVKNAVVPAGNFKIEYRKIRGVKSEGMICSQAELELGEDHSGIWVLPEDAPAGVPLAEYLNLDDIIFDISITPNRSDWLSHLGVAREISAYTGNPVQKINYTLEETGQPVENSAQVVIEDPEKCPRYTARVIRNVKIGESPMWLKERLTSLGMRPRNAAVDVTNYVMMESGQPLHAFDLNMISGKKIVVKTASNGDKFTTLDDKERTLEDYMLMICDAEKPVAIGGVMGGQNSEISDNTTDILLESAFFKPQSVRKTAKKLGLSTESSYRFERGVDIDNVPAALDRAAWLIAELTGGALDKGRIDIYPGKTDIKPLKLRYSRANKVLGINIGPERIKEMLTRLNFAAVSEDEESITVKAPSYRVDMELEIDIIEEIARLYGYDKLEPQYTTTINFSGKGVSKELSSPGMRNKIRNFFTVQGFNEILTQNITNPETSAIFTDRPIRIANPLGEELSVMRPSMVPGMLRVIERNIRVGNRDLALFEIGRYFVRTDDSDGTFIKGIRENEGLTVAITGRYIPKQWDTQDIPDDFYHIKGLWENFTQFFKFDSLRLEELKDDNKIFSKNTLVIKNGEDIIGYLGEVSGSMLKKFDIEEKVYLIQIDLFKLYGIDSTVPHYSEVAPFPGVERDLAFILDEKLPAGDVKEEIIRNGGRLLKNVQVFDVYAGKNIDIGKKSVAYNLQFAAPDRTLRDEEVDSAVKTVIKAVEKKFNASHRSF